AAVTFTSTASGGASGNTAAGAGSINDTVSLPPGATITYRATATISPTADGLLTNTATVTSVAGIADTNTSNNVASDTDVLTPTADLGVTKTGPAAATAGSNVTYTITVVNNGPSAAQDASLTDFTPSGTTFVSFAQVSGPAFSISVPPAGSTGTVVASNSSYAPGAANQAVFLLVLHFSASAAGPA